MNIKILILDDDRFFTQGLKFSLHHYFNEKGIEVDVHETLDANVHYYLVFIGVSNFSQYHYARKMISANTVFIIQPDIKPIFNRYRVVMKTIQRKQSLSALLHQIDEVHASREVVSYDAPLLLLTAREKTVLDYYSIGYSNIQIGKLLGIHQKTVSAHKTNAMNKLNFKHKGEFRRWIIAAHCP